MSLPNIHHPKEFAELKKRIENLKSDSPRRWGKMSPSQACVHLHDATRAALGEVTLKMKGNFFMEWIGKTFFISRRNWPKSLPTAPEMLSTPVSEDFEANRRLLLETLERAVIKGKTTDWGKSPIFGKLTGEKWGEVLYKHVDHHLRQFGV